MKDNDIAKRDVSVPKGFPRTRCYAAAIIAVIAGVGVLFILTRKGESVLEDNSDHKIGLISDVNPYGGKAQTVSLQTPSNVPLAKFARASFQRNAGLFAIAREGCLSGLQRGS